MIHLHWQNLYFSVFFAGMLTLYSCHSPQPVTSNPDPAHNSENALDWPGVYRGMIPCADCEGIKMQLRLTQDGTYQLASLYQGKDTTVFREMGKFSWSKEGSTITLISERGKAPAGIFKVGENHLRMLDLQGKPIEGALRDQYILRKSDQTISDKYWRLIELQGKPVKSTSTDKELYLQLFEDGNRLSGHGGCNIINGQYQLAAGNRIEISKLVTTMMACDILDQEQQYLDVLEKADNYTLQEDTLSLNKAKMAPLARFTLEYFNQ